MSPLAYIAFPSPEHSAELVVAEGNLVKRLTLTDEWLARFVAQASHHLWLRMQLRNAQHGCASVATAGPDRCDLGARP
jgi:hypothetical protein